MAGDGSYGEYAQVYNLETGDMRWGPFPNRAVYNAASVSNGPENGFAMIGGETLLATGIDSIYFYDATTDAFALMGTTLATPRTDLAAVLSLIHI